jgi:hypothetical protein
MRILSIHADCMWYRVTKKTKLAEPVDILEDRMEECVVLFCCVEKLDEKNPEHVVESAKKNVTARLAKLKVSQVMIYPYAHLTSTLGSPECALGILKGLENSLRAESISVRRAPFGWYKEFEIRGKGHPLADLSMTICPYEGTECDFTCPYCHHPVRESDMNPVCPGSGSGLRKDDTFGRRPGTDPVEKPVASTALLVPGCPEVPVQQALALHISHNLRKRGTALTVTGNPAVLNLLKVSDPEKLYLPETIVLEKCIEELVEKKRDCKLCIVFAHSDAGISYAATMRHLLPASRLIVIIFGKDPEALAALIDFPCEKIVDKAVHNPMQLRKKINEVFGWVV